MFENYGISRVIGVSDVLPVMAWKLDNRKIVYDNELLLNVSTILVEAANFKQVCNEAANDPELIKDILINMVNSRGKLHNPYTNTGGLIFGKVERIGSKYENKKNLKIGDEILVLISTSMIPLHIDTIYSIDFACNQIHVKGHSILFNDTSILIPPPHISRFLLMLAFEESSSVYHVHQLCKEKKKFLVVGSNLITAMLYGHAIRKAVGTSGEISLALYQTSEPLTDMENARLEKLVRLIFNEIYLMNLINPLKCAEEIIKKNPELFDLSTNCADSLGAETINVLTTKQKGTVFFSGLINNYNIALYLTEGVGKELNILSADGYAENYDTFMCDLLSEMNGIAEEIYEILHQASGEKTKIVKLNADIMMRPLDQDLEFCDFVYQSQIMKDLVKDINRASKYECPVLIFGETGVGKDQVTKLIHNSSNRKMQHCVKVNCAAIPSALMESEFFGYEAGAFTGANAKGKKGYFEQAHKGILFLDEISSLPMELQAKLLRVIQENEFYRVGGEEPVRVDVRIIAATNKDLKEQIAEGLFRDDLYYRLAVLVLHIPPLRERKRDIAALTEYFIQEYNEKYAMSKSIANDGLQFFLEYDWPGNIRELENLIQRILINTDENVISGLHVIKEMTKESAKNSSHTRTSLNEQESRCFQEIMDRQEKQIIQQALEKNKSTRKAAEALGMTQAQLMRKKKKHFL